MYMHVKMYVCLQCSLFAMYMTIAIGSAPLSDHIPCNPGRLAVKHSWKAHHVRVFSVTWASGSSHPLLLTCGAEGEMVSSWWALKRKKGWDIRNLQTCISSLVIDCVYPG